MEETTTGSGQPDLRAVGIDGGSEMISWSSVAEMESLAEQYGVSKQIWPIYRDCEIESAVPLEDAKLRSAALRVAFDEIDYRLIEESYWLSFVWKLVHDGNAFFIMV